jgi:hypothetical protein
MNSNRIKGFLTAGYNTSERGVNRSKELLTRNQDNVNEWSDMSIRGLLVQCVSTIQRVVNFTMNEQ